MGSRLLVSPPSLLASEPPRRLPIVAPRPPSRLFLRCRHLTSRRSPPPVCSVGSSWADSDESLNDSVGGWFVRKLRIEKEENGKNYSSTLTPLIHYHSIQFPYGLFLFNCSSCCAVKTPPCWHCGFCSDLVGRARILPFGQKRF